MKYIIGSEPNTINYDNYLKYVESKKNAFADVIYDFVSNSAHFDLRSPSSLHDAWLESFQINETRDPNARCARLTGTLILLGAFHDRKIIIKYGNITSYLFSFKGTPNVGQHQRTIHGDLFTHELRAHGKTYIHEILFRSGGKFRVTFSDFEHNEDLI